MAHKTWQDIANEVEKEYLARYSSVPKEHYENRQWVQVYVQMLAWKDKCRELHEQLYPVQPIKDSAGISKNKKSN